MTNSPALRSLVAFLLPACGGGLALLPPVPPDAGLTFTSNGPPDSGGGLLELDAGFDAGPLVCPPWAEPDDTVRRCDARVQVRLSAQGAVVKGRRLCAGNGQQPSLRAFVDLPTGLQPEVELTLTPVVDGGFGSPLRLTPQLTTDDAGAHWDLVWDSTQAAEGTYLTKAVARLDDAGFESNALDLIVDRTAPSISFAFDYDFDAGAAPRDLKTRASLTATDTGGCGASTFALSALSPRHTAGIPGISVASTPLPLPPLDFTDTTAAVPFDLDLSALPYDAWSTAKDGYAIALVATSSDLLGNQTTQQAAMPVTRLRAQLQVPGIAAGTPMTLGGTGALYLAQSPGVQRLTPSPLALGKAWTSPTDAAVLALGLWVTPDDDAVIELTSDGNLVTFLNEWQYAVTPVGPATGLAIDGDGAAYLVSQPNSNVIQVPFGGAVVPIGNVPDQTSAQPSALAISGSGYVLDNGQLTSPSLWQGNPASSAGQGSASPVAPMMIGGVAIAPSADGLVAWELAVDGFSVISSATLDLQSLTRFSGGDLVVVDGQGAGEALEQLSPEGDVRWSTRVAGSIAGPLLLDDATIVLIDGNGVLQRFDSSGLSVWASPSGAFSTVTPLLDPCVHALYAHDATSVSSIVIEGGIDANAGAWPMPGHDVFQSFDGDTDAAIDCELHL